MDAVSYSHSAKQAQRLKKIIANPDSTSGIVTVPSVIASGETITIPTGRMAVLPNLQIDGTLDIQGDVFVPSGSTFDDLDAQIALKAPLASPVLTGTPTAPTPTAQDNSTKIATTAYVDGKMVLGTAINSTSGTSIDFTGIPSWVKKITVMLNGVSTTGTSNLLIRIGSISISSTGYTSTVSVSTVQVAFTDGFGISTVNVAAGTIRGSYVLDLISTNSWLCTGLNSRSLDSAVSQSAGSKTLSGVLDRIRITTVNGTDTFDAGQINILYEG